MIRENSVENDQKPEVRIPFHPADGPPFIDKNQLNKRPIVEKNPKEIKHNSEKFETLVDKSSQVLFRAQTVFPFRFFPDMLIIDENKVNIIHGMFFASEEIQSILIHNIKDVIADTSIIFASLKILPDGFNENWVELHYLWRNDAIRARRIIAGLLVGFKEGIDMTKVETPYMEKKIEALGTVS